MEENTTISRRNLLLKGSSLVGVGLASSVVNARTVRKETVQNITIVVRGANVNSGSSIEITSANGTFGVTSAGALQFLGTKDPSSPNPSDQYQVPLVMIDLTSGAIRFRKAAGDSSAFRFICGIGTSDAQVKIKTTLEDPSAQIQVITGNQTYTHEGSVGLTQTGTLSF